MKTAVRPVESRPARQCERRFSYRRAPWTGRPKTRSAERPIHRGVFNARCGGSAGVQDRRWYALRDSNPCFRRERAMSWTARRRARRASYMCHAIGMHKMGPALPAPAIDACTDATGRRRPSALSERSRSADALRARASTGMAARHPDPVRRARMVYVQSRTTLPELPERIAAKPSSNRSIGRRCVIKGARSRPPCTKAIILYQVSKISRP